MRQRYPGLADSELVLRVQATGDRDAYGELIRRHQASLRAFLWRLSGQPALADDLAQEAAIRGYDSIGGFRNQTPFRGWLFAIAYRQFLQGKRKVSVYARLIAKAAEGEEAARAGDPDSSIDLQRALAALEVKERAVLLLCDACGMSHSEAAAALELPLGSVKTYVQRAREKMRAAMAIGEDEVVPCRIAQ